MAIQLILSGDTLGSGFRGKANANFNQIIQSVAFINNPAQPNNPTNGQLQLNLNGGGFILVDLPSMYYTKSQVDAIAAAFVGSPYVGTWATTPPTNGIYASGKVVDYANEFWKANSLTTVGDVPGVSTKWDKIGGNTGVTTPYRYDFLITDAMPITISGYQSALAGTYGPDPTFICQELVGSGVYRDRVDVSPVRNFVSGVLDNAVFEFNQQINGRIIVKP
jgi:hypothetical protein